TLSAAQHRSAARAQQRGRYADGEHLSRHTPRAGSSRRLPQWSGHKSGGAGQGDRLMKDDDVRLETPKQLARRVGVSERQIRQLIHTEQLEYVLIGCRVLIPIGAFSSYIDAKKVAPSWQGETKDRGSVGSINEPPITSCGPNAVAAASARLVRQTAKMLRTASRNGSAREAAA